MNPLSEIPRLSKRAVEKYVESFASARVAVLGDVMLDRYFWGEVDRISPEAPVPVVRVTRRSARLGGAANVAANLRALGAQVQLAGIIGDDREGAELRELAVGHGIGIDGLHVEPGRETTEKVRIIARSQQVVRADFECLDSIAAESSSGVFDAVQGWIDESDVLVVSDYGKGVIQEGALRELIVQWRRAEKPVLVDPHVSHFRWYRGATAVTPNTREATQATGIPFDHDEPVSEAVFGLLKEMQIDGLLVTRGEHGMSLFHGTDHEVHIPTVAKEVYDVTGAGDTVISVLSLSLAVGAGLVEGVVMANAAAGMVVREVGTSSLRASDLLTAFI